MSRSLRRVVAIVVGSLTVTGFSVVQVNAEDRGRESEGHALREINHLVIIYEENHSFDNLYGGWEGVNGLSSAPASKTTQVDQNGAAYACLPQNDLNLKSPPLPAGCNFPNKPFKIDQFIPARAQTCPQPGGFFPNGSLPNAANLPGGCTRDIVHRYYQEQYQLNNGKQNRYVTGSDAVGLAMGYYDTNALPIYAYLHGEDHPAYAIQDNFFQSAFGGSFLNHQWLIAAATPSWTGGPASRHAIIDSNGMPTAYPLYTPTGTVNDSGTPLTQQCGLPTTNPNRVCGDYAVNTIQPGQQPFRGQPQLPLQTGKTIGDELSAAGVSWAWYSGGWSNAAGLVGHPGWTNGTAGPNCADPYSQPNPTWPYCPNKVFQFHHQPFNYYAAYAPGTPGRAHLQDEQAFIDLANGSSEACKLNSVSFVKPVGLENEHPGYTSETEGSNHLVGLLKGIENSACAEDTLVLVTYDEFGGQWDHVTPPGQGTRKGPHDVWGPGTRIPALVLAPGLRDDFVVDHTQYDTTSILATIEHRFGLKALGTRDKAVKDLSHVFRAQAPSED